MTKHSTLTQQIARAQLRLAKLPECERKKLVLQGSDPFHDRDKVKEAIQRELTRKQAAAAASTQDRPSGN